MKLYLIFLFISGIFTIYFLINKDFVFIFICIVFSIIFAIKSKITPKQITELIEKIQLPIFSLPKLNKKILFIITGGFLFLILVILKFSEKTSIPAFDYLNSKANTPNQVSKNHTLSSQTIQLEQQLKKEPENIDLYYKLSHSYEETKNLDKAILLFEDLIKKRPNDIPAYHRLIDLNITAQNENRAIFLLEQTTILQPKNPDVFTKYGTSLIRMQKSKESIAKFEKAILLDPGFGEAYYFLALAYQQTKELQKISQILNVCLSKVAQESLWRQKCQELKNQQ